MKFHGYKLGKTLTFFYFITNKQNDLDVAMPTGKELFYIIGAKRTSTQVLTNSLGNYEDRQLKAMDSDGRAFIEKFVL